MVVKRLSTLVIDHFSIPESAFYPTILPSCTRRDDFNILFEKFQELSGFLGLEVRRLRTSSPSTSFPLSE